MSFGRMMAMAGGALALLGLVALNNPAAWAQDATPEAADAAAPRPAHIHSGDCENLGDVVFPLTDLTGAAGDRVGQARRAAGAESSFSNVPATLDAILGADHAVNIHLSAEEIGTYIACGEIGGALTPEGDLIVGLRESSDSGFTGIAFLAPAADGASTNVSVFIAETMRGGRDRDRDRAADATPAAGGEQTASVSSLPEATPAADAGADTLTAGGQVPVSLTEFAIDMPSSLPAGMVTFAVTNDGQFTHSFEIESANLEEELEAELAPGETAMLMVELAPGTYEVYCPVGNHRGEGMELEVTVA